MGAPERVPVSRFRNNLTSYLRLLDKGDLELTKNGNVVAIVSSPVREKLSLIDRLAGSVHAVIDLDDDLDERRSSK